MLHKIIKHICPLFFCILGFETSAQIRSSLDAIHARFKNKENFKKQVINALTRGSSGSKFIFLANDAAETIDDVDNSVKDVISSDELNTLPLPPDNTPTTYARLVPPYIQNIFDEVVNYVITEKNREEVLPDPPPPPDASYDYCFPCDKERKDKYSRDTADYLKQFFAEHRDKIYKAMQVLRYFALRKERGLPYDKEAASRMSEKMEKDLVPLLHMIAKKVLNAWTLYKKNATQLSVLTQLVLSTQRQFQLLAIELPKDFPELGAVGKQMYTTMMKFYEEAVDRRDYSIILNINWFIGLLRQSSLLYGDISVPERLAEFMSANRFEMKVDADAEMGGDGQTMMAKIKGSNFFRAIPDTNCKLRWHLYDPDASFMQYTLEKTEVNLGAPASYTGTKEWQSPPAQISLGFCDDPKRDTVIIQTFSPKGSESWIIGGQTTPGYFVQAIIMNCFMDEKRVRAAAAEGKARLEKMKKELMEEYDKAVAGNKHLLEKDPGLLTPEERHKVEKLVAASQKIQDMMVSSAVMTNLIFKESLRNNLKTVFESELDGRELFPKNKSILHAKFKVEIVHVE